MCIRDRQCPVQPSVRARSRVRAVCLRGSSRPMRAAMGCARQVWLSPTNVSELLKNRDRSFGSHPQVFRSFGASERRAQISIAASQRSAAQALRARISPPAAVYHLGDCPPPWILLTAFPASVAQTDELMEQGLNSIVASQQSAKNESEPETTSEDCRV
eukprot:4905116-Alexandrium_andersonii.AAC.1